MRHPAIVDVIYVDLLPLCGPGASIPNNYLPGEEPWTEPFRAPPHDLMTQAARDFESRARHGAVFSDFVMGCYLGRHRDAWRTFLDNNPGIAAMLGDLLMQQGGLADFEERVAKRAAERVEAIRRDADRPVPPGDMARDIAAATPAAAAQEKPVALRELATGALAKARAAIMSDTPERARFALDTYVSAARAADMADMRQAMTDYLDRLDGRADNVVRTPDDRELEGVRHFLKDGETPPSLGAPCAAAVDMINEMRGSPEWQKVANHMAQPDIDARLDALAEMALDMGKLAASVGDWPRAQRALMAWGQMKR